MEIEQVSALPSLSNTHPLARYGAALQLDRTPTHVRESHP